MGKKRIIKETEGYSESVQQFFDEFIEQAEARLSPKSVRAYKQAYDRLIQWNNGEEILIEELNEQLFYKFINGLKKEMIKPASINCYLRGWRTFVNWLYNNNHIDKPIKIKMVAGQEEEFKCYSIEEIQKLLVKPRPKDSYVEWRTWAIVNWCLATGNRAATVRNVQIQDVDFRRKEIRVRHTKNKKVQVPIPMSREIQYTLKEFIKRFRSNAAPDEYLFCDVSGEQLSETALTSSIRRFNISRGVNNTSIHSLRHTFARQWLLNTGDVFKLQKILGHSTLEMTRRYCNLLGEDLKENFETFNPLDNLKKDKRFKIKNNEIY